MRGFIWAHKNPGKPFFLKLAKASVDRVNRQRDENRLSYNRKVMMLWGMVLNTNRFWEKRNLYPALKTIINKKMKMSDGEDHRQ